MAQWLYYSLIINHYQVFITFIQSYRLFCWWKNMCRQKIGWINKLLQANFVDHFEWFLNNNQYQSTNQLLQPCSQGVSTFRLLLLWEGRKMRDHGIEVAIIIDYCLTMISATSWDRFCKFYPCIITTESCQAKLQQSLEMLGTKCMGFLISLAVF